ncbi:MAG TPA: bifunctional UDP-N-acetylglucosamine diphosphorylase/glucosamine-1-phosphate N-acetyltransferase GlmU [Candidatus Acidoferrales bacterium]|nr:bifunctional UDP-N-acetylglucosamine diphosphorylase/glucosamine-1-phosphate N-acetyltransferase GlmU [Candidatus Acidoferrales bacterium]
MAVIVLAAGEGKRMRSSLPKVLHRLGGKPLLFYALRTARQLSPARIVVVVGYGADEVKAACQDGEIVWALQEKPLGTGDAVRAARGALEDFSGDLVILSGDVPFVSARTVAALLRRHRQERAALSLITAELANPSGYGRIARAEDGTVRSIVEERDASAQERAIREVNAGIYAVRAPFIFSALAQITNRNDQQEYYLPDIVRVALGQGQKVVTVKLDDESEIRGINTREELALMEQALQERINRRWMEAGVTFKDPRTAYVEEGVVIGKDTVIGPNTHLLGRTVIGERCLIDGNAYLTDARLGDGVHLKFNVVITESVLEENVEVGPFAHLRPGTVLKSQVHIGNFVEVKNSTIGEGTKASHLTYIGDAEVGRETNIGAGTITCNYDGFFKYRTHIGDRVQIGSDTQLVAPVKVGDDAYVGAGTTVTEDVPPGALALSRTPQKNVPGWVERFRAKRRVKQA